MVSFSSIIQAFSKIAGLIVSFMPKEETNALTDKINEIVKQWSAIECINSLLTRKVFVIEHSSPEFVEQVQAALHEFALYPIARKFVQTLGARVEQLSTALLFRPTKQDTQAELYKDHATYKFQMAVNFEQIDNDETLLEDEQGRWHIRELPRYRYLGHELVHIYHYSFPENLDRIQKPDYCWTNAEEQATIEGDGKEEFCENAFAKERGDYQRVSHMGPVNYPHFKKGPNLYAALKFGADGTVPTCSIEFQQHILKAYFIVEYNSSFADNYTTEANKFMDRIKDHKIVALNLVLEKLDAQKRAQLCASLKDSSDLQLARLRAHENPNSFNLNLVKAVAALIVAVK